MISKLENAIRSYQDDDLYRFNPVRYAIQTGMAESEAIALFLHATRSGLFTMDWQLVCAGCGHLVESLRSVGNCILITAATYAFPRTKPRWMISSTSRLLFPQRSEGLPFMNRKHFRSEDFYFKYRMSKGIRPLPLPGEPTLNDILLSFTKLLTYLKAGERQTIELDAPIGSFYRISDLLNNTVCVVNLGPALDEHIQQVQVTLIDHKLRIADKEVLPVKLETPTAHFNYQQGCTLQGVRLCSS